MCFKCLRTAIQDLRILIMQRSYCSLLVWNHPILEAPERHAINILELCNPPFWKVKKVLLTSALETKKKLALLRKWEQEMFDMVFKILLIGNHRTCEMDFLQRGSGGRVFFKKMYHCAFPCL